MQVTVMKLVFLIQKQISKKDFQIFCCFMNTFLQVGIIGTNECVSEVPSVYCKDIIGCGKAKRSEVLDKEDRRCSCVAFAKNMNLPQP